ncbi:MAG TPA: nucleoside-diphosphate sugar epimerase [Alphaproteobacteria bacterium]|nr:nucleoside-diphosphate sugar epimerase [Alphaproteobacteria bacterium]
MTPAKKSVWVLADQHIGNLNQCVGVAEALGLPYQTKRIVYNRWARLPNLILGPTLAHLSGDGASPISAPWPDIVIAAGRRTAPVARAIKRFSGGHTFLVQTMWPGLPTADLDLIAAPFHDRLNEHTNLIRTIGAPHNVTQKRLNAAAKVWVQRLGGVQRPRIALLVGGNTRHHRFTSTLAGKLGQQTSDLVRKWGGGLMVSTSRRTESVARNALLESLEDGTEIYIWRDECGDNPYLAYLALSDSVVVTGDSTSMCTEACATGRPVYIFAPAESTGAKHRRLHRMLYEYGSARPLSAALNSKSLTGWSYEPINDAAKIAREIGRRIGL